MARAWKETYDVYVPAKGNDEAGAKQVTGKGLNVRDKNKMRLGQGLRDEAIIENLVALWKNAPAFVFVSDKNDPKIRKLLNN